MALPVWGGLYAAGFDAQSLINEQIADLFDLFAGNGAAILSVATGFWVEAMAPSKPRQETQKSA